MAISHTFDIRSSSLLRSADVCRDLCSRLCTDHRVCRSLSPHGAQSTSNSPRVTSPQWCILPTFLQLSKPASQTATIPKLMHLLQCSTQDKILVTSKRLTRCELVHIGLRQNVLHVLSMHSISTVCLLTSISSFRYQCTHYLYLHYICPHVVVAGLLCTLAGLQQIDQTMFFLEEFSSLLGLLRTVRRESLTETWPSYDEGY